MPRVIGGRKSTYLLLSGIRAPRIVQLGDGLELLPLALEPAGKYHWSGLDLFEKHYALLLLAWVSCQLKVTGSGTADVAHRAWDSMWDVLLLGAVHNTSVTCGLQATAPYERFTDKSRLHLVHFRVFDPPAGGGHLLTEEDCQWLETNFRSGRDLMNEFRFQTAVHCLSTYDWHSLPRAQLALIWAGIEGLFEVDTEITFRVSLYAAKFLEPSDREKQRAIFESVKKLYSIRSKAVHGGKLKGDPHASVRESALLLSRLVRACIERNLLPDLSQLVP